jgi:hypothetical protein
MTIRVYPESHVSLENGTGFASAPVALRDPVVPKTIGAAKLFHPLEKIFCSRRRNRTRHPAVFDVISVIHEERRRCFVCHTYHGTLPGCCGARLA